MLNSSVLKNKTFIIILLYFAFSRSNYEFYCASNILFQPRDLGCVYHFYFLEAAECNFDFFTPFFRNNKKFSRHILLEDHIRFFAIELSCYDKLYQQMLIKRFRTKVAQKPPTKIDKRSQPWQPPNGNLLTYAHQTPPTWSSLFTAAQLKNLCCKTVYF